MEQWAVIAEGERAHWDYVPFERVGPLCFGMTREAAGAVMREAGFVAEFASIDRRGPHGRQRGTFRRHRTDPWAPSYDVLAYFVDTIGLTCVVVGARSGPQVVMDGIRLIGRPPSDVASELVAHLEERGMGVQFMPSGDVGSTDLGVFPDAQRGGDTLVSCALFGRPNTRALSVWDSIPNDAWDRI
ncbi:hypothetical protein [Embleya sp. NPDC059237]|uniref:hypothetical protein n=1 Tax=Embleya sp. NPDC059237 TaxID=3346784 RepID=UPI00367C7F67